MRAPLVRRRTVALAAVAATTAGLLGACATPGDDGVLPDDPDTIRVLAGSEVEDMGPILADAAEATGVKVAFHYTGTLEGTERVAAGGADEGYDAVWFPNNRYLSLLPEADARTGESVRIMSSPVVLGLRADVAAGLGWDEEPPTWAEVAEAAADGEFTYGMTNPAASNSGFSALVAVATALSGTGTALQEEDIEKVTPELTDFFSAQKLTAGSSGWLAEKVVAEPDAVDGLINYESVLMGLELGGEPVTIVTPSDGVVTSDYPLTLLASASGKQEKFDALTAWLTTPEVQERIAREVHRRPAVPGVDAGGEFGEGVLFETPFPNTIDVTNTLISTYLESVRAPSQAVFVLDTSGSMDGDRIESLKSALAGLSGADTSTTGVFTQFRERERITLLPFNDLPGAPVVVDVPEDDKTAALEQIRGTTDGLYPSGGTAIYDSLRDGYELAAQQRAERPDTFVSVVLMSDGENTDGSDAAAFEAWYAGLGAAQRDIPVFVVLFGEGDVEELTHVAELTGGQVFDATNGDLAGAFQEIRGYQ
ncbi:VWA domain-containing protein [Myceligenerans crystallogenes]|uniref:Substrate-binding domain-containing protein n=1 Tax=Myceligenerans crystallogenes TaxID=316335 RepID=A0ABN2N825_9MICO